MQIKELFDKDPKREIESIIKVNVHDPAVIRTELEEYVVTEQIRNYFEEIIDRFVESRTYQPSSVCTWISGFFGSGKSHFLKLLGYVLENKMVQMEDGSYKGAADYFCRKNSLSIAQSKILEKELETKAIFVNMLDFDRHNAPTITRIIYGALLDQLGLSTTPWVAEIERLLQEKNVWDEFLNFVNQKEKKPWKEVRKNVLTARSILSEALSKVLPNDYPSRDFANQCITDVQNDFEINPSKLAERLIEEAKSMDPEKGRILILLDEIGLYIGEKTDRLTDLNTISENISSKCNGKVWLYVTAQEALEEIIPKVGSRKDQFEKIKDRFEIKATLTPENIDTVVKQRLLQKTSNEPKIQELKSIYFENSGSLNLNTTIKKPARDPNGLFTNIDENQFLTSYPLLPYHVRLIQDILGILRSSGDVSSELTGRERAVLNVIRSILINGFEKESMINSDLGKLVTFDLVYDAISEELKVVKSNEQAIIEHDIQNLGSINNLQIASVAKALFLLQPVGEWLPCTLENISAVLYSDIGLDNTKHQSTVKKCLDKLREGKWISVDDEKYRFLTEVERNFVTEVGKQRVTEQEKRELALEILKENTNKLKSYNYESKIFDVKFLVDDRKITTKGHIKLKLYSPYLVNKDKDLKDKVLSESFANPNTIYWISKKDNKFDEDLDNYIRLKKALLERNRSTQSDEERKILEKPQRDKDHLRDAILPRLFKKSAQEGMIIIQGTEISLGGDKKIQELFNQQMKQLVEKLFTLYKDAAFKIKDDDIGKILTWNSGSLPEIYKNIGLIDSQDNILTNRRVATSILAQIRTRYDEGLENNGASISAIFDAPPYGWDTRIVRLVLATLFKNDSISISLDGKDYYSPSEPGSKEAFTNKKSFNRTIFSIGEEVSHEERDRAIELISEIFGVNAGNTTDEVDNTLKENIESSIETCKRVKSKGSALSLPNTSSLEQLFVDLEKIVNAPTKTRRIKIFLEDAVNQNLSKNLVILRKMEEFENKIKEYQELKYFVDNAAIKLNNIGIYSEDEISSLKSDLNSKDFYDRWSSILSKSENLTSKYYSEYEKLHGKRNNDVSKALETLQNHKALQEIDDNKKEYIFSKLKNLKCDNEDFSNLKESNYRCPQCNSDLSEMDLQIQTIENRREEIKSELDRLIRKTKKEQPSEEIEGFKEEKVVKSIHDIQEIIEKMQDVVEKAEEAGKKVKANIELEVE